MYIWHVVVKPLDFLIKPLNLLAHPICNNFDTFKTERQFLLPVNLQIISPHMGLIGEISTSLGVT